jgi:DNA-binding PadR family transcriptional regulator
MTAARTLTELEGCVLGLVWSRGPCTAYVVRKDLLLSASPHWSGSAGAIYPLMERLARQGLIRSRPDATGRRASRKYVVTAAGLAALRAWLGPPLPPGVVGIPPDPLRTRLYFLEALPPRSRRRFLSESERKVRTHLARAQEQADRGRGENLVTFLADRGAVLAMAARLEWIHEITRHLAK